MKRKTIKFVLRKLKQIGIFDEHTMQGGMSDQELQSDRKLYQKLNQDSRFLMDESTDYICRYDKYAQNGFIEPSYFIQDIWGARKIFLNKPSIHYDVGSSVNGFIAHLLSMGQKTVLIDIRHMENSLNTDFLNMGGGVTYMQADATNMDNIKDNSIESLSALCSVEHFGLGRYGDPIDPQAWEKALKSFQRVLKPGGKLYISVPVGQKDKVCFNAGRSYNPQTIIQTLDQMKILEMGFIKNLNIVFCIQTKNQQTTFNYEKLNRIPEQQKIGNTGLFEFIKK